MNRFPLPRLVVASLVALGLLLVPTSTAVAADADPPTPTVPCDAGSLPESSQGRVPLEEVNNGRAAKGYTCNARQLGQFGAVGGYQVLRYVDKAGHECAYYDTTLTFGRDIPSQGARGTGVYVMDMTDPAKPTYLRTLATPAMDSPHESLRLNQKRGLLAAISGTLATGPGVFDVYDVSADCRNPVLRSSTPLGILGHESGFAPDGKTFYSASLGGRTVAAIDVLDPVVPKLLWVTTAYRSHGISLSEDGNRLYMAESGMSETGGFKGLVILDTTEVQNRTLDPTVPVVSRTTWPNVSTPQYAEPFTSGGKKYVMEVDEFGEKEKVGAARIIDVNDEKKPFVLSSMRLAVHQEAAQASEQRQDPGATATAQGYRAHNCTIPTRVNPTIVACSMIVSGLRVFDIADPANPQEIAYFNGKIKPTEDFGLLRLGAFAMSAPVVIPERREIWYSDGNLGFHTVRLTPNAKRVAGLKPTGPKAASPVTRPAPPNKATGPLPATGLPAVLPVLGLLTVGGALVVARRRRTV